MAVDDNADGAVTSRSEAPLTLIVAYRNDRMLADCLKALGKCCNVVVIDNSPATHTRSVTVEAGASYVESPRNLGFAGAVNLGLHEFWDGARDVLLLNPDARIGFDEVIRLQHALRAPGRRRAAVGPRLVGESGKAQRADWPVPSPGQVWLDALGAGRFWRGRHFVVGAVLLLRAEALVELGGLDERYFLYAEEADWQLRAQRAGWTVAVVDEVTAFHVGGASSTDEVVRNTLFHSSAQVFARRWYGRAGALLIRLGSIAAALRRSIAGTAASRAGNRHTLRILLTRPHESLGERAE
jgi:GT2 family glycosyltransferase